MEYAEFIESNIQFEHVEDTKAIWFHDTLEEMAEELGVRPLDIACTLCTKGTHSPVHIKEEDNRICDRSIIKPWHYHCVLSELIHRQGFTMDELAEAFGVTTGTVKKKCKSLGVIGKKRVAWDIPSTWEEAREETIDRDGACVICGITNKEHEREYGRTLDAHHVVPRKVFDEKRNADSPDNLVALCKDCHAEGELTPRRLFQKAFGTA